MKGKKISTQTQDAKDRPGRKGELMPEPCPQLPTVSFTCSSGSSGLTSQMFAGDTRAHVCPGSYTASYGGTWRHYPSVPPIVKLENRVSSCGERPDFSLEGNVFAGEVCVRLSRLLAAEPEDNEDYLTETNTDKWSTFLNSFQSTNSYFLSFSGPLRNL